MQVVRGHGCCLALLIACCRDYWHKSCDRLADSVTASLLLSLSSFSAVMRYSTVRSYFKLLRQQSKTGITAAFLEQAADLWTAALKAQATGAWECRTRWKSFEVSSAPDCL